MLKGKRIFFKNADGEVAGCDYSDCEAFDIAPKTYEGRTVHSNDDLSKTRRLAIQLLISRGATLEDASGYFEIGVRTAYRAIEGEVSVSGTGEDFGSILGNCIQIMSECDYTIKDLSMVWNMSQKKIKTILNDRQSNSQAT